jgi:class 3 adenylate cyclase
MGEERRLVTILFADVSGSTALGEALDPEDTRALLARFYVIAKDVIAHHGGTLEKFIGDAIMAVFGLPQAHGDDARRALAAALALRDRVRDDALLKQHLPVRIGLNTGEVVAARDPSAGDFLVTGDPVNTAARLQQVADPWTIVCTERTARAAGDRFAFGAPVEVAVKGKREPIRAVPLVAPAAGVGPRGIPFVGRDADLAQLELVARRAFSERRPFLVSLVAPAGTGKTRLVEEFLNRLPQLAPAARTAIAQCLPYGQRLTYWPLRAVLFRLIDAAEDAAPDIVQTAAVRWLEHAGVDSPGRIAEYLTATVGLGEAKVADRDAVLTAWRTVVEVASREAPFVLVFEDLHWSSDSLLDLVEFVMQPRGDLPVVIFALTRPELLERRPAWGGGRRNYLSIALPPLDNEASRNLVQHLLGRPSPEIVSRIAERAEGNPFYAGEIVRAIVERVPSLRDTAAVERVVATLPDTVQATVLARLDLLSPVERRVLQLGSVFGRAFRLAGLTALDPQMNGQLDRVVDRLIDRDLIRASEGDRFAFRHILIREVAYQTLPRAERANLHDAAGRWLEGRAKGREDSLAELIAYHCREAALLSAARQLPADDAAAVRRRAVQWLGRADFSHLHEADDALHHPGAAGA